MFGQSGRDMKHGVVNRFDETKDFGFISRDNGEDIFVHFSAVETNGFRNLQEGQSVEFKVVKGPKGWMAADVKPITGLVVAESMKNSLAMAHSGRVGKTIKTWRATAAVPAVKNGEALVSSILKAVRKPGIKREAIFRKQSSRTVYAYSVLPSDPTKIVREAADGSRMVGRLRSGVFREIKTKKA